MVQLFNKRLLMALTLACFTTGAFAQQIPQLAPPQQSLQPVQAQQTVPVPAQQEALPQPEPGYTLPDCANLTPAQCDEKIKTRMIKRFQREESMETEQRRKVIEDREIIEETHVNVDVQPRIITDHEVHEHVKKKTIRHYRVLPPVYEQGETVVYKSEPTYEESSDCVRVQPPCQTQGPCPCPKPRTYFDSRPPRFNTPPVQVRPVPMQRVVPMHPVILHGPCAQTMIQELRAAPATFARHYPVQVAGQNEVVLVGRAADNFRDLLYYTFGAQGAASLVQTQNGKVVINLDQHTAGQVVSSVVMNNFVAQMHNEPMKQHHSLL